MGNEIAQRAESGASPITFAGADATSRLEPLGVPVGRIITILRRHIWLVIMVFAVGVGSTSAVIKLMSKQYTAEATILIQPQRTQVSDLQAISNDSGDVSSLVRTQIDILRSPELVIDTVKALNLTQDAEFAPHGGLLASAKALLEKIGVHKFNSAPPPSPSDATQIAAAILSGKLGFANETRSSVLKVSVTTHDPALSALAANELAKRFLDFKREEKYAAMQRAHDWFQEQMVKLASQLSIEDHEVEQYRQQYRLDELPSDDGSAGRLQTINRQQLDAVSRELTEVSRDAALKEGQLAQAEAVLRGDAPAASLPQVVAAPMVTQLLPQISNIAGLEAQLAATQGSGNPELVAVRAQLRRLQARAASGMNNVVRSIDADVKVAHAQELSLRQHLEQLRRAVSTENSAQIGLQVLQDKTRATRSIYESFLNRATQLANVAGIQEQDASLVSSARPPLAPSAPQSARLLAVAMALSLLLGIVMACIVERARVGFSLPEQLEATLGVPLIAIVPTVSGRALRGPRETQPEVAFTASLNKLRGQMRALAERRPKVVMITSALPQEGKSVFAAGLVRNAAAAGLRVLLIECDIGYPSAPSKFSLKSTPGLSEVLSGGVAGDVRNVIQEVEPRLHVITAGSTEDDSQELLASDQMSELLSALRTHYDMIVLDTPAILPVADALVIAGHADATLMIVRWEKTSRAATQHAMRLLHGTGASVMGVVMTRVNMRTAAILGGHMLGVLGQYGSYAPRKSGRKLRLRL